MANKIKEGGMSALKKTGGFFAEFKEFISRGNVVELAVGVIIGAAFGSIVTAFTDDFINPLIAAIGGAEVAGRTQIGSTGSYIEWGAFITAVINFLITAFCIFLIVKTVNKLMSIGKKEEAPEEPGPKPDDVVLLEEIRDLLKLQNGIPVEETKDDAAE